MNRFKKELHKLGYRLESDYPEMPYYIKGAFGEVGNICIESIIVNTEKAYIYIAYNVIDEKIQFNRNMKTEEVMI